MRLIDADALYSGAMKDEWFRFKERDNNGKESFAYSCAMQRLVEAPTVDAIPIEQAAQRLGRAFFSEPEKWADWLRMIRDIDEEKDRQEGEGWNLNHAHSAEGR